MAKKRTVGDRVREIAARPGMEGLKELLLPDHPPEQITPEPLVPLPFERPLDKPQMAAVLGVTVSGLDKLIATNKAPPHFRAGRLIRWRPSVALAWLAEQEKATTPTS
jgi:predicted DNA-binding transcriptional regulator AlpA